MEQSLNLPAGLFYRNNLVVPFFFKIIIYTLKNTKCLRVSAVMGKMS